MDPLDQQHRKANIERIASHTVGIASDGNTGVGTGTLVLLDDQRFILTANHVLGQSKLKDLRFWLPTSKPMRDKADKYTTDEEVKDFTIGAKLQVVDAQRDEVRDVAALRIDPNCTLPDEANFYDMRRSIPLMEWDERKLDGLSLLIFGFPFDNSREVTIMGNRKVKLTGCAEHLSNYSAALNKEIWGLISSKFSPNKDFAFPYNGDTNEYEPHGFSGCGVCLMGETPNDLVWNPDPIMIGIAHSWFSKFGVLLALKLPAFIDVQLASTRSLTS